MNDEQFFATRHARPERNKTEADLASKDYPDLTEGGVEQAKERARVEISNLIDKAPEGSVIIIAATSDQPRTKQTAEIYGDELAEMQKERNNDNLLVITKTDVEAMTSGDEEKNNTGFSLSRTINTVKKLDQIVNSNKDKKIVIDYPLMIKELAYKYHNRWTDQSGKKTEYFSEILKKYNNNHEEAGKDWMTNQGRLELPDGRTINGPKPEQVGAEYFQGVQRLHDFVKEYIGERPLIIGEVGHQWDLDALITYLGNQGKVDQQSFEKITGGQFAGEAEMAEFLINDKETKVKYRNKEFVVPQI